MVGSLRQPENAIPLPTILGFRVGRGLPLHVARRVGTVAHQRYDVVDDVAGTRPGAMPVGWAGVLALELGLGATASDRGGGKRACVKDA